MVVRIEAAAARARAARTAAIPQPFVRARARSYFRARQFVPELQLLAMAAVLCYGCHTPLMRVLRCRCVSGKPSSLPWNRHPWPYTALARGYLLDCPTLQSVAIRDDLGEMTAACAVGEAERQR